MSRDPAFVSDCGQGLIRRIGPWPGEWNCVEGVARAVGAHVYQGSKISPDLELLVRDHDRCIVNGNSTLWWLPSWLRARGVSPILLWEGGCEDLYKRDAESGRRLRACLNACDGVLVHGPEHVPVMRSCHGRVGWLGCPLPSPVDRPGPDRSGRWLNAPVAFHRGLPGALLLADLGVPFAQHALPAERPAYEAWLSGADVEYREVVPHARFRRSLREFRAVLNWDSCATAGRHVIDCSAAGVPCVSADTAAAARWLTASWRLPPPPCGRAEAARRLSDRGLLCAAMPLFEDLMPDRIRRRWERFVRDF